jgi:hypothetical protein
LIEGVSGSLVSHHYAEHLLETAFAGRLGEESRDRARRGIRAWWRRAGSSLGPASPLRAVFDVGASPLLGVLGFAARQQRETARGDLLLADAAAAAATVPVLVAPWGIAFDSLWSAVARESARLGCRWALCFNGRALRLCDGLQSFAREYLEFDFEALADHPAAMALFWGALRADAFPALTAAIVSGSASHGVAVSASLREGVREALQLFLQGMLAAGSARRCDSADMARVATALEEAFILVYRVLFLLFAESRALVPAWHPVYRRSYSIESLRRQAERPGDERGIWEALQAVSRLAHAGCHAGSLVVAPFNGRLFAPSRAPLAESRRLDDQLVANALLALTTRAAGGRRERVSFGDLGVEQLGAVYESVLDYEPEGNGFRTCVPRPAPSARTGSETAGLGDAGTCVPRPAPSARTGSETAGLDDAGTCVPRPAPSARTGSETAGLGDAGTCVPRPAPSARTGSETAGLDDAGTCVPRSAPSARTGFDTCPRVTLVSRGEIRKSSGTFYTPRAITEYLVRHTLEPLVENAGTEELLRLRVLDPAMGSGALLVAACRHLATAYEAALVRERGCFAADITEADRAGFRRLVAQHCLYGVDANPMAVQVARLSMWLTTLARGRPLSFLDHRVVAGDSLVGASLEDVLRQPPGGHRSGRAPAPLPLFENGTATEALQRVMPVRHRLEATPDDTADAVHAKERMLADTRAPSSALTALRRVADLWCACWFWDGAAVPQPGPAEFGDLAAALRSDPASLPARIAKPRLDEAQRIAGERRFLHWTLEFPEVFFGRDGAPLDAPGFDAILGNPPWEMVRGDTGETEARGARRSLAAHLTRFARQSGVYRACSEGHANQYQLFVERSLGLLKRGGRLGLVLPWGLASDHGSAALRRLLFERCSTDAIVGFENANGIFPIHRGVRFLLLSASPGGPTREVRCRLGERDPAVLEEAAASPAPAAAGRGITLTPALLRRLSGPGLAIPYIRRKPELQLVERLVSSWPALADEHGWAARFGRELNRSDDRGRFSVEGRGMPVVEGKHVDPFRVRLEDCEFRVARPTDLPNRALQAAVRRHRLAYRDVASATNRLTLIAALVPPGAVTVHTLFCLKNPMPLDDQFALSCLLNSLVANYLVRLWVTTHLGTATVERLPVPRPFPGSWAACRLRDLGRVLVESGGRDPDACAEAQGLAAALYGLTSEEFALVLESFPLVDAGVRLAASDRHRRLAEPHGQVYTSGCSSSFRKETL